MVCCPMLHFNPRSPHGERRYYFVTDITFVQFQPTLPARGATTRFERRLTQRQFQPTLPARGATIFRTQLPHLSSISTHAPRTGSDKSNSARASSTLTISTHAPRTGSDFAGVCGAHTIKNFNPRSPHGERLSKPTSTKRPFSFQPTLPARGATIFIRARPLYKPISTHAPRTGSDG